MGKRDLKGRRIILTALLVVLVALFATIYQLGGPFGMMFLGRPIYVVKPSPYKYGKDAITVLERLGYYAQGDQWSEAKSEALDGLKLAKNYEDAREEILKVLKVAGGKHSTIWDQELREEIEGEDPLTEVTLIVTDRGQILSLKLPPFVGEEEKAQAYADSLIQGVEEYPEVVGYIVDLRENTGGDMGPMIAGLSPLIPDGEVMGFVSKSGNSAYSAVVLENGAISGGGSPIRVKNLKKMDKPVAVLQGEDTASSGEATLLAFKGLDYVRFFGGPSAGYASANMTIPLYDGGLMLVTVAGDRDRRGQEYMEEPILPDVETQDPVADAVEWLESQI